jgi:3-phenylpropionate/trans-cinnamate dioxygenase ferredoxin reductase subunit
MLAVSGPPIDTPSRVAVVGVSLAGVRAAEELRRRGFRGELTMIGQEPHFPPYDRPPLSKEVLGGTWQLERARLRLFEELEAEMRLGRCAVGLDLVSNEVRLDDDHAVGFDALVIATGARARRLGCQGSDLAGIHHFREAEDCTNLIAQLRSSSRVVIIGGSFIGSEVASVCRGIGAEVTIVDALPLPMSQQVGADMASYLIAGHERNGVRLRLGVAVAAVEGHTTVEGVELADGSLIPCDTVIVGIGVTPATNWLDGSGLAIGNGVICDEHCLALGARHVAAAGDVANWLNPLYDRPMRVEHWTNAIEQAEYAARALLGDRSGPGYTSLPYFWSDLHKLHLQFAGVTGEETELVDGAIEDDRFVMMLRSGGEDVGVVAVNWPAQFQRRRRALLQQLQERLVSQSG